MGALRNYLPIECYCSELQMSRIVESIAVHIDDSQAGDITDFDDMFEDVRVCVEFEPYMDRLDVKVVEVLNRDWDLLHGDSAVLTSRLRSIVVDYNRDHKELIRQSMNVREDYYA